MAASGGGVHCNCPTLASPLVLWTHLQALPASQAMNTRSATESNTIFFAGAVLFFGVGLVQMLAASGRIEEVTGLQSALAGILASLLAYFPLVGSALGVLGAVQLWGWSWTGSILLFFGGSIAGMALMAGAVAINSRAARLEHIS